MPLGGLYGQPIDQFLRGDQFLVFLDQAIAEGALFVKLLEKDQVVEHEVLLGEIARGLCGPGGFEFFEEALGTAPQKVMEVGEGDVIAGHLKGTAAIPIEPTEGRTGGIRDVAQGTLEGAVEDALAGGGAPLRGRAFLGWRKTVVRPP